MNTQYDRGFTTEILAIYEAIMLHRCFLSVESWFGTGDGTSGSPIKLPVISADGETFEIRNSCTERDQQYENVDHQTSHYLLEI